MRNNQILSRGFTLVEVLIVVAVIVIITAILLPVFARVRENGRKATCASNLKQLGLAWQMYADDSDGKPMPFANSVGGNSQFWTGLVLRDSDENSGVERNTGLLHPWLKNDQIYLCPSWAKDSSTSSFAEAGVQGYGYNSAVFRSQTDRDSNRIKHLAAIEKPAEMVVFADAVSISGIILGKPELISSLTISAPSSFLPTFHGRHNGMGNVLWADGHPRRGSLPISNQFGDER
jgi:prepilin-type N-terminal cleavage/methylation domain-containing protein/prepilin-type processing-associated H-X9-DG protein